MPSQGSAALADGPPHGNTSSYPSMADRSEREQRGKAAQLVRTEEQSSQNSQEGEAVL